jgi:hypothetical protein
MIGRWVQAAPQALQPKGAIDGGGYIHRVYDMPGGVDLHQAAGVVREPSQVEVIVSMGEPLRRTQREGIGAQVYVEPQGGEATTQSWWRTR